MKPIPAYLSILAISLIGANLTVASSPVPVSSTDNADRQAIEALLGNYTRCLTERDEAGFRALLLNEEIPFTSVQESTAPEKSADLRHYENFRQAVFGGSQRYRQTFYNVRIDQHGPLAQVSLNFLTEPVTRDGKSSKSLPGWKVLQLLKIGDRWKIASELYTFEG